MASAETLLWVCADCLSVLANGNDGVEYMSRADRDQFWVRFSAGMEREAGFRGMWVVPGGPHHCGGPHAGTHDRGEECTCDEGGFSRYPCNLCGSPLAGDRFAATVLRA